MDYKSQKNLQKRVAEIEEFAASKNVLIIAAQRISPEGYIECVPLYKDLSQTQTHGDEQEKSEQGS